jgi:hypothetical protein
MLIAKGPPAAFQPMVPLADGPVALVASTGARTSSGVNMEPLPRPVVSSTARVPRFWATCVAPCGKRTLDVGPAAAAAIGCAAGADVAYKSGRFAFLGVDRAHAAALLGGDGRIELVPEDEINRFARDGHGEKNARGRSGTEYPVREDAAHVFGFLPGERVRHPLAGDATVVGVFAGSLWMRWEADAGEVTQVSCEDVIALHRDLVIIQPRERVVRQLEVRSGSLVNYEVEPCRLLEAYGLRVGDLAAFGDGVAIVLGLFSVRIVVAHLASGAVGLVPPSALALRRRHAPEAAIIQLRAFNGAVVDVDVACDPARDALCPFDRVVTVKGLATVRGRDPASGRFWVETDDAYALNLGVLLLSGDFLLVRRTGPPFETGGRSVNMDRLTQCHVIPGDVILRDRREYIVIGERRDAKEYILRGLVDGAGAAMPVADADAEIVARSGFPSERQCTNVNGQRFPVRTDLAMFRGAGMKPGDVLDFALPEGARRGTVIGAAFGEIWVHFEGEEGAHCLQRPYGARASSSGCHRLTASLTTCTAGESSAQ